MDEQEEGQEEGLEEEGQEEQLPPEEPAEIPETYADNPAWQRMLHKRQEADERAGKAEVRIRELEQSLQTQSIPPQQPELEPEPDEFDWEKPQDAILKAVDKALTQKLPEMLRYQSATEKSAEEAMNLFPELRDPSSEFFKSVSKVWYGMGLNKNPEGIKLAASYVATTQMPEILQKSLMSKDNARRNGVGFVEGGKTPIVKSGEDTLSSSDRQMLEKMGLSGEQITAVAKNLSDNKGGQ